VDCKIIIKTVFVALKREGINNSDSSVTMKEFMGTEAGEMNHE
jgi:hypothetical protein